LLPLILAPLAAPEGAIALGAAAAQVSASEEGAPTRQDSADARRRATLDAVKIPPAQALRVAAQEVPAGVPLRVAVVRRGDHVVHDIRLLVGDREVRVDVDAVTGALRLARDSELSEGRRRELASWAPLLRTADVHLLEAAELALSRLPESRLLVVEAEVEEGALQYEVTLLGPEGPAKAEVDAATGQITALVGAGRQVQPGTRQHFDDTPVGAAPEHWGMEAPGVDAPPGWAARAEPSAPSPPHALGLASGLASGLAAPSSAAGAAHLAWSRRLALRDGGIEVRLRLHSDASSAPGSGGLVWRLRDGLEHYAVLLDGPSQQLRLDVVKDGQRRRIAAVPFQSVAGHWYRLAVQQDGDRIAVTLDGQPILEAHDGTLPAEGQVGVWCRGEGVVLFDDLEARPVAGAAAPAPAPQ